MFKESRLHREENGSALIIYIFVLFALLGIGGLVVDLGIIYKTKGEMRKAANAAALSGVQAVFNDQTFYDTSVDGIVEKILKAHNKNYSNCANPSYQNNKVTVTLRDDVPLYFMKIFGIKSPVPLEVSSSAIASPLGAIVGAAPIGIRDDMTDLLHVGDEQQLTLQPGDSISGNFNLLSLGTGTVRDNLINGYNFTIAAGTTINIDTDPGAKTGQVRDGIQSRLDNNNTILIVVIYDHNDILQGKSQVTVKGFAFFDISGMTSKDNNGKTVIGTFIKKVAVGDIVDGAVDRGAYGIKLVE